MKTTFTKLLLGLLLIHQSVKAQTSLEYYLKLASENNPEISDQRIQKEAALLELEQVKRSLDKPKVSVTGNYLFSPIVSYDSGKRDVVLNPYNAFDYKGYDLAASNGGAYVALVNINQSLFNQSRYDAYRKQSDFITQMSDYTADLKQHELEKQVTDQYIRCIQDRRQIEYAEGLISIIAQQRKIVNQLMQSNEASRSDSLLLHIEQKAQEIQLSEYKSAYRKDLMELRTICGETDTSLVMLEDVRLTLREDDPSTKFTKGYTLDSLNLQASQRVSELKYKPSLSFFANSGLNAVYAQNALDRYGFSTGINFSWLIGDGKQKQLTRQRTAIRASSSTNHRVFFSKQNDVRKASISAELRSVRQRLKLLEVQLIDYEELLSLYNKELANGEMPVINYLSTLKNLASANRDYLLLATDEQLLINQYNFWNW